MPTIDDLITDIQFEIRDIKLTAEAAADMGADSVSRTLGLMAPLGQHGSKQRRLANALTKRTPVVRSGTSFIAGVSKISDLGDPNQPAPRKTIKAFLQWAREVRGVKLNQNIKDKSRAWWLLPEDLKNLLEEEREKGRFGGRVGKAPYWWIQEEGSPGASIAGSQYLSRARAAIDINLPNVIRRVLSA